MLKVCPELGRRKPHPFLRHLEGSQKSPGHPPKGASNLRRSASSARKREAAQRKAENGAGTAAIFNTPTLYRVEEAGRSGE